MFNFLTTDFISVTVAYIVITAVCLVEVYNAGLISLSLVFCVSCGF